MGLFNGVTETEKMKAVCLVVLCLQNAVLALWTRYVRIRAGDMFFASVAVLMGEFVKLAVCLVLMLRDEGSISSTVYRLRQQIWEQKIDTLKVGVPSLVYCVQNNLLYMAASNLDAATYQVTYQLKIFTTAVFSVFILRRQLLRQQWLALLLLLLGVVIVQLAQTEPSKPLPPDAPQQSYMIGLICAIFACILSGFGGVYFEAILKGTNKVTVWVRNVQMAGLSVPVAIATVILSDGAAIADKGLLFGFDLSVWICVLLNASGGLIVALVVKYADNILKGFATSAAIVVSCLASVVLFHVHMTPLFVFGASLVVVSTVLYSYVPTQPPTLPPPPPHGNMALKGVGFGDISVKMAP